jgi:membrane-associated phospholipid phosphatase
MRLVLLILFLSFLVSKLIAQSDSILNVDTTKENSTVIKSNYLKESIVPLSLAVASLVITAVPNLKENFQAKLMWNNQKSSSYINLGEDYVRYAPSVAAYALSVCGLKSKHKFIDRSVILAIAYIASDFVVYNTKKTVQEPRPDKSENTSFPSQHTAMAFVAATFLDHELGYISPWISVGGYAVAGYVGYARIARNAHFTNDVLMGAAVGILMTNATYWAYDGVIKLLPENITISPVINPQQTGMYVCYKF